MDIFGFLPESVAGCRFVSVVGDCITKLDKSIFNSQSSSQNVYPENHGRVD